MASSIQQFLNKILSSRYGKDVRQAIHDSIEQCYEDVTNPDLNTGAFETAVQNKIDSGELAVMTIPDGSITKEKLDQDTNDTINKNTNDITDLKNVVDDIGIGADGITYKSAGEAVREQMNDLKSVINYKGFSTSRYNALYKLLSAVVYDSEKISSEEISSITETLFGNSILEGVVIENPSAKMGVASYVYSDDGETSIYSAGSGTQRFVFDAVKEDTTYKIYTSKKDTSKITCYAGSVIDDEKNIFGAVIISDSMPSNQEFTAEITIPKGRSLAIVYTSSNFGITLTVYKEY